MKQLKFNFKTNFLGHTGSVYAAEKSSEASFYTAGADGVIAKWDISSPNATAIAKLPHKVFCLRQVSEDILVAGTSSGGIYIIDLTLKRAPRNIQFDTSICYNICPLANATFATVHESGKLIIWDAESGAIIKASTISDQKLRGICALNGQLLVGTGNGEIVVLESSGWKIIHQFDAHEIDFGVNCLIHDETNKTIISGGKDGHINYWNQDNLELIERVPAHNYAIYNFAIDPDCTTLFSSSRDKSIKVWDLKSRSFIQKIVREKAKGHTHSVNSILALNQSQLISVGDDKKVISWEVENSN